MPRVAVGIHQGSCIPCQLPPCCHQSTSVPAVWWEWGQHGPRGSPQATPGLGLLVLTVHQPHCVDVRSLISAANANENVIPHPIFQEADCYF